MDFPWGKIHLAFQASSHIYCGFAVALEIFAVSENNSNSADHEATLGAMDDFQEGNW